ncbi:exopolysaccharide biosynthesis polyprenyl glycosylphosphotransferase [Cerasicoccus arenae]|uniref:Undecaprenyl-phosphate glucose phosphotransferase n=1 Tax=Cerasicoccus arenae TaxID=424488 RepID=A0A8J3D9X6_9BACT|nr:exopolysaccharide biosynthesis polyprenyl glycosylphosphotransferase [Cerasicoccus arenae]MBK1859687.1 exopolysaccharide biosynthesis polyprenyl glycosylphosphotransferase [Cerasicoccus arenae]GHB93042.1 undecaprenyl-phosphate glucose phosphotransferase [Cerasicoccus arenae]
MLDRRSQGLLMLHGCIVILALNALFFLQAVVGVELTFRYSYNLINFPLYLMGITACGLIFFNFYPMLAPSMFQRSGARVFQVTNLQSAVMLVMLFGIIFATKDKAISRIFVGTYLILSYFLLFTLNTVLPKAISGFMFKGGNLRRCLVVGRKSTYESMRDWLETKENLGVEVIGLIDPEPNAEALDSEVYIGNVSNLAELVKRHYVNQLILLETRQSKIWVNQIMHVAEEQGCQVMIYNPWAEFFEQPLTSIKDGPHTFFIPREEPLESPFNRLVKRGVDLLVSLPILLFILPPLILWVRYRQRKESPGPVFFKQQRRGYNRAIFTIYKFRSMHVENDDEARQATKADPRVFRFGEFIRRTSIDELPQFWNVFKGNMSIVGPRPHLPEHDILFGKRVRIYPQRHFVKPGITGYAQCNGFRGEITDSELLRARVQYDLEYITEWSVWLDLEIMARTVWIVVRPPESAY